MEKDDLPTQAWDKRQESSQRGDVTRECVQPSDGHMRHTQRPRRLLEQAMGRHGLRILLASPTVLRADRQAARPARQEVQRRLTPFSRLSLSFLDDKKRDRLSRQARDNRILGTR